MFALCHLLGFYFMPRIRDLKDQQLYRIDRLSDYGVFTPLLTKTADCPEISLATIVNVFDSERTSYEERSVQLCQKNISLERDIFLI